MLLYYRGVASFNGADYARAEKAFRKLFYIRPDEEIARYLYYSLRYQGLECEAEDFRLHNSGYTFVLPRERRGLQSIYTDFGPRLSANDAADNILYADAGLFANLAPRLRLWSTLSYLQQDADLGHYKQSEVFSALTTYVGAGWYLRPAIHYAYVPYTFVLDSMRPVFYTASYRVGPGDTLVYKTNATQHTITTSPGYTHCLTASTALNRRFGRLFIEAEPTVHLFTGRATINTEYNSVGVTDSFRRNRLQGSRPFLDSGSSSRDTSYQSVYSQLGIAVSYWLPLSGEPLTIYVTAFGLQGEHRVTAAAIYLGAVYWLGTNFRISASWLKKGALPLALHSEGMYFNFDDPIESRAGITFQLFPLKHFSPALTYQYEHDTRLQDGAALIYHSIYLTLKYSL